MEKLQAASWFSDANKVFNSGQNPLAKDRFRLGRWFSPAKGLICLQAEYSGIWGSPYPIAGCFSVRDRSRGSDRGGGSGA